MVRGHLRVQEGSSTNGEAGWRDVAVKMLTSKETPTKQHVDHFPAWDGNADQSWTSRQYREPYWSSAQRYL